MRLAQVSGINTVRLKISGWFKEKAMRNIVGMIIMTVMASGGVFAAETAFMELKSSVPPSTFEAAQVPVRGIKAEKVEAGPKKTPNIFDRIRLPEKVFAGKEDSAFFSDACTLQLRKGVNGTGDTVLLASFQKEDKFRLDRALPAHTFYDATPETSLVTSEYPVSMKNPRVAIKFDQRMFKTQGVLIPVEYKIIIEMGNHYFGSDKVLYRCIGLR